jgi:hypothetical protein
MALRDVAIPAELKFLVVFGLGVVASFGLGGLATRSRAVGRIL